MTARHLLWSVLAARAGRIWSDPRGALIQSRKKPPSARPATARRQADRQDHTEYLRSERGLHLHRTARHEKGRAQERSDGGRSSKICPAKICWRLPPISPPSPGPTCKQPRASADDAKHFAAMATLSGMRRLPSGRLYRRRNAAPPGGTKLRLSPQDDARFSQRRAGQQCVDEGSPEHL